MEPPATPTDLAPITDQPNQDRRLRALIATAKAAAIPLVMTDSRIHRRGHVHWVWWPSTELAAAYASLWTIVHDAQTNDYRRLWLIADVLHPRTFTILIPPQQNPTESSNG